jgi:rRNA maturation endonuclease Nob1
MTPPREEWPPAEEQARFQRLLDNNLANIFRATRCLACGKEIPQARYYCSKECGMGVRRLRVKPNPKRRSV